MINAFCLPCKCLVLNIFDIGSHRSRKNKEVIVEISIFSFHVISNLLIQESRKMMCLLCARCLVLETKSIWTSLLEEPTLQRKRETPGGASKLKGHACPEQELFRHLISSSQRKKLSCLLKGKYFIMAGGQEA